MGAQNVIDAALECHVQKVIALSTDKAANRCMARSSNRSQPLYSRSLRSRLCKNIKYE
ncbi:MAG: polysaccharide biosynthesis protein [Sedimentisphaerales bacterium]